METNDKRFTICITGASGSLYAWDLLQKLCHCPAVSEVFLVISSAAREVISLELGSDIDGLTSDNTADYSKITRLEIDNLAAPIASGSFSVAGTIICPCTMSTLGHIASGAGTNLIHRAADVCLKEKRDLVLVPRETPLNYIHLENMIRLQRAGAVILPAMPSFYSRPDSVHQLVETVTYRILSHFGFSIPPRYTWTAVEHE
jgi:4-hydroxy-3-polyprenylbenzoate decarboxylase